MTTFNPDNYLDLIVNRDGSIDDDDDVIVVEEENVEDELRQQMQILDDLLDQINDRGFTLKEGTNLGHYLDALNRLQEILNENDEY